MIFTLENMAFYFSLVDRLENIEQPLIHHPEIYALNHTLQVVNHAFRETFDIDLILAAFLHDVGKFVESHGHEDYAVLWLTDLVSTKTLWLIQEHMRVRTYVRGEMRRVSKCKELANHAWFPELVQLMRWDNLGRKAHLNPKYDKEKIVERLNKAAEFHFKKDCTMPYWKKGDPQ